MKIKVIMLVKNVMNPPLQEQEGLAGGELILSVTRKPVSLLVIP